MLEQFLRISSDRQQYVTKFPDGTAVCFHLLSYKEVNYLNQLRRSLELDEDTFYEEIFNICVTEEWKNIGGAIKAGIPKTIGLFIEFQSNNYSNFESELDAARRETDPSQLNEYMKNIILYACPSYKYEDLDSLDRMNLIKLFSRAENLLILKTEGKYELFNYKKATRKPKPKIDFASENKALNEMGGVKDSPMDRAKPGMEMLRLRQQATDKHNQRLKRIQDG